jgi:hypothetical protein
MIQRLIAARVNTRFTPTTHHFSVEALLLDYKTHLAGMVAARKRVENAIFRFLEKPIKLPSLDVERRVGDERRRRNC